MKPILILEHQSPEQIAYLGTWLKRNNIPFEIYNAHIHKQFPNSINGYSALAVMGGYMSANDPLYTNRQAEILILQAMNRDIPVIGHCLGGQLISKALCGKISNSPKPEIGWHDITYVDDPETKEWFGENPTNKVMHWHYESFEIPHGAKLLASSQYCPNQAFSFGIHLAMQYHIEMDVEKVEYWMSDDESEWRANRELHESVHSREKILDETKLYMDNHQKTADCIYKNWLKTTEFYTQLL